jgi:hypothetical protein
MAVGLLSGAQANAQSGDARAYIQVREKYETYRCQQAKLMQAQGEAANGGDMEKARELYLQRAKLMTSPDVQRLENEMVELRDKLMTAHNQEDYDAILAAEGEMRGRCR